MSKKQKKKHIFQYLNGGTFRLRGTNSARATIEISHIMCARRAQRHVRTENRDILHIPTKYLIEY